jgi:hypothetical protein
MTPQKLLINQLNPSSLFKRSWVLTLIVVGGLAFCPMAQAVEPAAPDTDRGNGNTSDGQGALLSLTTGFYNSAFGFLSVLSLTDQSFDTGVGAGALLVDTTGTNTAVGAGALFSNTTGFGNNAFGTFALFTNVGGFFNNAHGHNCLLNSSDGDQNNAFGDEAMFSNTTGSFNSAFGDDALHECTVGDSNVAMGDEAGNSILDGSNNVCIGSGAGDDIVGGDTNTVLGDGAGAGLISGDQNVYIGAGVSAGADNEIRFIRIGDTGFTDFDCFIAGIFGREIDAGTAVIVGIDANQKLGTVPVTANGKTVPFKPQAMLDESLRQQKRIAELEATVERQQKGMEVLTAQLKEQAAQIQKVSAQLEVSKSAPRTVANK